MTAIINSGRRRGRHLRGKDDGQIVRVLHNGDGTIDVVVRDPSNPSGKPSTQIACAKESYLANKLASGRWFE